MFNISEKEAAENESRDKLSEAVLAMIMKAGSWHAAGLGVATNVAHTLAIQVGSM